MRIEQVEDEAFALLDGRGNFSREYLARLILDLTFEIRRRQP